MIFFISPKTRGHSRSYTTKSGFRLLFYDKFQVQPGVDHFWKFLWSISLPRKQLLFMWKLFHQAIPTIDVLKSHHLMVAGLCKFGCKVEESIHHLFFSCDLTKASWLGCFSMRPPHHLSTEDILSWLKNSFLIIVTICHLWKELLLL